MKRNKEVHQSLGKAIKMLRERKGFAQEYMAAKLSMSQTNYSKLERGENCISLVELPILADLLDSSIFMLFFLGDVVKNPYLDNEQNALSVREYYERLLNIKEEELKRHQQLIAAVYIYLGRELADKLMGIITSPPATSNYQTAQ